MLEEHMTALLERYIDQRATAWNQVQEIREALERDGRDPTTEEDETYTRALDDVDRLGKLIEKEDRANRLASVDFSEVRNSSTQSGGDGESLDDLAERYQKAFGFWMRQGASDMDPEDRRVLARGVIQGKELRALGVGTGSAGGYTVPEGFRDKLIETMKAFGGMLELSEVIRTDSGQTLPWPTIDDTANVGAILAENTQITEQDVTMGTANLDAYMYTSKLVRVAWQLLNDSAFDVEALLRRLLGTRIGRIWNQHFTTGTGTAQPDGIMTNATVGKQGATGQTTTVIYDDLIDVIHSVDPAYRSSPNAGWMVSDTFLKGVRKLKDLNNLPLWQPSIQAGVPDQLLAYPVRINQDMAVPAASAKTALFGDIREAYVIRIVQDIQMVRLNERYADFLQAGFFSFARADGTLQNAAAVRAYQQSAT